MEEPGCKRDESGGGEKTRSEADHLADQNALLRASVAEMRDRISELEQQSESDPATGLPDERRFFQEVERVVGYANRHGTPAALLYVHLDGLAAIAETRGRLAADAALIHVGKTLSRLIRSTDVLAAIGSQQFGLILDHLDHNSAIETAERLARCIAANPVELGGSPVSVAVTIGTATSSQATPPKTSSNAPTATCAWHGLRAESCASPPFQGRGRGGLRNLGLRLKMRRRLGTPNATPWPTS